MKKSSLFFIAILGLLQITRIFASSTSNSRIDETDPRLQSIEHAIRDCYQQLQQLTYGNNPIICWLNDHRGLPKKVSREVYLTALNKTIQEYTDQRKNILDQQRKNWKEMLRDLEA